MREEAWHEMIEARDAEIKKLREMLIRAEMWISTQPDSAAMCAAIQEIL